jgi:hypothetical protein
VWNDNAFWTVGDIDQGDQKGFWKIAPQE